MSTREIAEHIGELNGAEISADLVSTVTDSVLEEVAAWQGADWRQPTARALRLDRLLCSR